MSATRSPGGAERNPGPEQSIDAKPVKASPRNIPQVKQIPGSAPLHPGYGESRIAEMQGKRAERTDVTLDSLIKEAGDIQRAAMDANSYAAAISALIAKAKLCGLWVERTQRESSHVIYAVSDEPMSEEEWERRYVRPG